ncbi:MAG: PAS domain S-box protein [Omnitrophica WOR_2 bacterium]
MVEGQKILPTTEQAWKALVADLENRLQQSESERDRLQDDLSQAKQEARLLIQHAPTAIYEIDFQGPSFKSVNDAMCQMTGYSREELLAMSPFELLDEESQKKFQERYRQSLAGENLDPSVEYQVRTKDGRTIYAALETTFMSENGRPSGALVIAHDVTERKRIMEKIKESERKYRELIQFAPVGIYEVDFREQKFTSVNDAMCLLTGYRRDELLGMNPFDILDEPGRLVFKERIVKWLAGEKPGGNVEYRALAKDGHEIYAVLNVTFTADSTGGPLGATVIGYDITERKHAEQALAKSEQRYRTLVETSPDAIFVHANNHFLFANSATLKLFGAETFEQLSAHTVLEVITPADRQPIQARIRQTLAGSKTPRLETRISRLDGRVVPIEAATSLIDYQGQQAIQVMVHDISDRKQAEEALRQSQQKYATILQTVESGFWLNDLEGKLLEVNEAYCRMSGYSRDELLCMNISDLEAKETAPEVLKHIRLIKMNGHHEFETFHKRKDGSIFDVDIRASYLKLEGDRFVVFAWDISDRKKMEQQLREINEQLEQRVQRRTEELQEALHKEQTLRIQLIQAEKYAALARLVGSVAHEINNPLQTIQNSLFY